MVSRQLTLLAFALAYQQREVSAFSSSAVSFRHPISLSAAVDVDVDECGDSGDAASASQQRRAVLSSLLAVTSTALSPMASYAGLLDDYGTDPGVDKQPKKKVEQAKDKGKAASNMEPNLRSNYYYPTNKVRYLPRIKKCSDAIPGVAEAIGREDWEAVNDFAKSRGGGTNVKVGFAGEMTAAAKKFEKNQALLVKAVSKKDVAKTSDALEGMSEALLAYRTSGRLLGPDGGGDIPSVDEIRRSTKRFRGEAFEKKIKDRDARVAASSAAAQ
ncbi:hypothetical protein THAOC_34998 [Thalassiosira oceanica]|uniref:Photosystem II Psb31 protein domain-containing protein n=1 Tax=Thalassiosira oceanica TaxID=159749 RepID=K0RI90_THAOC|nr:hypothetical protein THAOC_34998 [Thalassiosira oceanica]|eukprot:EJK46337.1 hypothetical protein THAOC_34998 [Thalassiosira oceanica]